MQVSKFQDYLEFLDNAIDDGDLCIEDAEELAFKALHKTLDAMISELNDSFKSLKDSVDIEDKYRAENTSAWLATTRHIKDLARAAKDWFQFRKDLEYYYYTMYRKDCQSDEFYCAGYWNSIIN